MFLRGGQTSYESAIISTVPYADLLVVERFAENSISELQCAIVFINFYELLLFYEVLKGDNREHM